MSGKQLSQTLFHDFVIYLPELHKENRDLHPSVSFKVYCRMFENVCRKNLSTTSAYW